MATVPRRRRRSPFNFNTKGFGFGHSASAALPALRAAVLKVGLALVGGDFSGTGRGHYSIDLQGERTDPNQVANAQKAVAIGNECTASAQGALALGLAATANAVNAVGIGNQSWGGGRDRAGQPELRRRRAQQRHWLRGDCERR